MSKDLLDLDRLLAPLDAGADEAGIDLHGDLSSGSPYGRLRDARSAARAEERRREAADDDTEVMEAAGWHEVLSVGTQALSTQSKDLEIAAWMTEALVRIHGLPGLATGARLIAGLCDRFWDSVYPRLDEDGLAGRASPIGGLAGSAADGTIMQPLRRLTLFRRADRTPISLYLWERAEQTASLEASKRDARYDAGALKLETLEAEARMDMEFLVSTGRDALAAAQAWSALESVLDARFGDDSPSLRKVRAVLERMVEVIRRLGGVIESRDPEPDDAGDPPGDPGARPERAGTPAPARVETLSRESALTELGRIADYFRRTEPHSPLAYTLDEAVRRGRMPLADLLAEVLPDAEARKNMLTRLGIRPAEES